MLSKPELERIYAHSLKVSGGWDSVYISRKVEVISKLLSTYHYSNILDIGSSSGIGKYPELSLENLASSHSSFVHLDLNRSSLLDAKYHQPISDYVIAEATTLPFRDGSFDSVFASEILEHLPNSGDALNEWSRVLKPGGHLIIFTPNVPAWLRNLKKLLRRGVKPESDVDPGHVSEWEAWKLCRILRQSSFNIIEFRGFNFVFVGPIMLFIISFRLLLDKANKNVSKKFNELMCDWGKNYPQLCDQVLVVATKCEARDRDLKIC